MTETPETKKPFAPQVAWRDRNPLKRWAHIATASAVRRGLLVQQPCEVCGAEEVDAHHDDHAQPLKVRWLCRAHHRQHHAEERRAS